MIYYQQMMCWVASRKKRSHQHIILTENPFCFYNAEWTCTASTTEKIGCLLVEVWQCLCAISQGEWRYPTNAPTNHKSLCMWEWFFLVRCGLQDHLSHTNFSKKFIWHTPEPCSKASCIFCFPVLFSVMGVELTSILGKGLGFVPTPPIPHPSGIEKDINKFARTLRLKI